MAATTPRTSSTSQSVMANGQCDQVPSSAYRPFSRTTWYCRGAALYLPARVRHWAEKLGVAAPPILIREPRKRWGSCDAAGNVRINWRVVQVAPRLIDYVIRPRAGPP